ncbi:MAG: IclR family transcriptional regulator [Mesorhizobium sp.]
MLLAQANADDGSVTVKSARRALQILEYLKEIRRPAGTTDIAMALNCPISSTSALLKSLASLGYLLFDRRARTYQASVRVGLLGGWHYEGGLDPVEVDAAMERLAADTDTSVFLATRNDVHVQYIRILSSGQPVDLPVVGSKHYLTQSVAGMLMMSKDEVGTIEKMIRRINSELSSDQDRVGVREAVERISSMRARGYAQVQGRGPHEPAVVARLIAAPNTQLLVMGVFDHRDEFSARAPVLANALGSAISSLSAMRHHPDLRVVS